MGIIEDLEKRGYIEQITHDKELREELNKGNIKFYIGIDLTADSMHIGHFVALMIASHLQKAGNTPIILMGEEQQQLEIHQEEQIWDKCLQESN